MLDVKRIEEIYRQRDYWQQVMDILLKTMDWDTVKDLIIMYAKKTKASLTRKLSPEQMAEMIINEQQDISSKG